MTITIGSHTGTHIDVQRHVYNKWKGIDKEPLSKYIGESITIDLLQTSSTSKGITYDDLERYSHIIKQEDILLIYTGTSEKWTIDNDISKDFAYLEPSAAEWIVKHRIKCLGIDSFSIEKFGSKDGQTHKILLSDDIGIIENLTSKVKETINKSMFLVCLPLPFEDIDGSPSRVISFYLPS